MINNGDDPSKLAPIVKDINRQWYHNYTKFSDETVGVRPALNLRTAYSNVVIEELTKNSNDVGTHAITIDDVNNKERFVFNGVTWVKLDDYIYISELPIAFGIFDSEMNVYKISEIREFLWDWYGYEKRFYGENWYKKRFRNKRLEKLYSAKKWKLYKE